MKKLRILTICHMFPTRMLERHGIFMCREAEYLSQHNIECDFLVARPWAPWPLHCLRRWTAHGPSNPLIVPEGLQAREVRYPRPPGRWFRKCEGPLLAALMKKHASRWHSQDPFHMVLGVPMIPDAEAAASVADALDLPLATLAIGSDVMVYPQEQPALWQRIGNTLKRADLPIGVCDAICDRLMQTGECRKTPLCVYLSRDETKFVPAEDKTALRQELGWPRDAVVGVYVGLIGESKGMLELAAAARQLLSKHENFVLVCVGDGPALDTLRKLKEQLAPERLILPGQVAPLEVPKHLQAADFMVFPSHSEGMPQAVIEAMNCGLPVVATNVGGTPEAVIDNETGILVQPRDEDQLREAMNRIISDAQFREQAGARAHQYAHDKFEATKNAKKLAEAIWSLAG